MAAAGPRAAARTRGRHAHGRLMTAASHNTSRAGPAERRARMGPVKGKPQPGLSHDPPAAAGGPRTRSSAWNLSRRAAR
jgi:hypothetical protein